MVQWICFDWGDTLADIRGTFEEVERDHGVFNALHHFGIKVSTEEFDLAYDEISKSFAANLRGSVKRWQKGFFFLELCNRLNFPITTEESSRMSHYYNDKFISKLKLLSGASELIESLAKKQVRLALISNANGERIRQQLEFFKLNTYFSIVLISDELGFEKSSVEPFKIFLTHARSIYPETDPVQCVMVGDRADEDGYAKLAGMRTVIIKRSHRPPSKDDIKPDYEVKNITELKELLISLL